MSKQEEQRTIILGQVAAGILGLAEASTLIGVSERQVRRLFADFPAAPGHVDIQIVSR